jgi:hypothetical protein
MFLRKITKKWANLVYLFIIFQGTSKSGKISKPIFPDNLVMLMLFPGFDKLSTTKNTNATFFRVPITCALKLIFCAPKIN